MSFENRTLLQNPTFLKACDRAKNGNGRLHFLGLVSYFAIHLLTNFDLVCVSLARVHSVINFGMIFSMNRIRDKNKTIKAIAICYLQTDVNFLIPNKHGQI